MKIIVSGKLLADLPKQQVKAFIQDLLHIQNYEPKLDHVYLDESKGVYRAKGKFFGFSWSGKFTYHVTDDGFVSEMVKGPMKKMHGGFNVRTKSELSHFECYYLQGWIYRLMVPILSYYLKREMKRELKNIADLLVEDLKCRFEHRILDLRVTN